MKVFPKSGITDAFIWYDPSSLLECEKFLENYKDVQIKYEDREWIIVGKESLYNKAYYVLHHKDVILKYKILRIISYSDFIETYATLGEEV